MKITYSFCIEPLILKFVNNQQVIHHSINKLNNDYIITDMIFLYNRFNASYEENMAALLEDAKAIAVGIFLSIVISLIFVILSVLLVSWSALRQVH